MSSEQQALKKFATRLVPFLALLYFAAFIDRTSVSFAAEGMNRDLGFSSYIYGLGAGIFFLGYVLFEVPSNLFLHAVGARRWIARIMISWAVIAGAMALVKGPTSFYVVRLLLGVAEAGFFPGVVYFLTRWVPAMERARLIGLFMTAIPISTALGGPLAGAILRLDGLAGLAGWQWLYVLETIPSLLLGLVTLAYLPDTPSEARWLTPQEKDSLLRTLEAEAASREVRYGSGLSGMLRDPRIWTFCLAYFGVEIGLYGVILWLPQIFAATGVPSAMVSYAVAIPYAIAAIAMVWWCRHSDHTNERVGHIVAASLIGFLGLAASAYWSSAAALSVTAITLGAVGTLAILPIFWTLPAARLNGRAAAGGIALINAVGNLGGFVGPFVIGWIKNATGSFTLGLLIIAGGVLLTGLITPLIGHDRVAEGAGGQSTRIPV